MKDNADTFTLNARREGGGTPTLNAWGANSDYGTLRSVLLGPIENYKWLQTSSVSKKTLRRGVPFDANVAKRQHAEMVSAYQSAGVEVHTHAPDPHLHYQVYARDSSVMTPYGAFITAMSQWWRRGENSPARRPGPSSRKRSGRSPLSHPTRLNPRGPPLRPAP